MRMAGRKGAHNDAFAVFETSIGRQGVVGEATEVAKGGRFYFQAVAYPGAKTLGY